MDKTIAYVTDIFSGAVAILDDCIVKEVSSDIVENIVTALKEEGEYIASNDYIYRLNTINLWKARRE